LVLTLGWRPLPGRNDYSGHLPRNGSHAIRGRKEGFLLRHPRSSSHGRAEKPSTGYEGNAKKERRHTWWGRGGTGRRKAQSHRTRIKLGTQAELGHVIGGVEGRIKAPADGLQKMVSHWGSWEQEKQAASLSGSPGICTGVD